MALRIGTAPSTYHSSFPFFSSSSSSPYSSSTGFGCICSYSYPSSSSLTKKPQSLSLSLPSSFTNHICKAAEYKFPDPIPEFADSTEKFKTHLRKKFVKNEIYGDSAEEVVEICTEIFKNFLHTHYGGPGTLLVLPFIDMADTVNERGLPGGSQAARTAVKWAQKHVDKDWNEWTGGDSD
ncbi:hypothetical protein ACJW30_03G157500 [Castanea mollissima]